MDDGVGNKLHEARTRRKLSLQEVEEATKIRGRYLLAIEHEDWDQLPGETYARAFIRTYAALVGLDGDRLAEEQRRRRGAMRPGERLPRVDPRPRRVTRRTSPRRRIPSQLVTAVVLILVVGALVAVVLASGGGSEESGARPSPGLGEARAVVPAGGREAGKQAAAGHTLELSATGEVWVCLLDGRGRPLVAGRILDAGESEGPFRSGSFTLALGNGAVTMTVDGKRQSLPQPPSPIGFAVDGRGSVSELPEGERPTCT